MSETQIPEHVRDAFFQHYGIHVSFIGEDAAIVALGHHGNERAVIAAFNRHAAVDVGLDNIEGWTLLVEDVTKLTRTWAAAVAVKDTAGGADGWRLEWPVPADDPWAFPVMVPASPEVSDER